MMFSLIVDDQIQLNLLEERHAEALFVLVDEQRAYLRKWLPWLDDNRTPADSKAFIKSSLEQFARNDGFQVAIRYQGQLVGVIGYLAIAWATRSTEIGYWLAEPFQGRGIMSRACRFLVGYAFNELGLNRVQIHCAVENRKSCAIPERLGFKNEGILRQSGWLYDHFIDHVVYSVLAEEWPA